MLITDCNLTDEKIEVPEFVLGYPIAGIGSYAFFSNSYVKDVSLPPAVISIGEYAFANNEGLEYVAIPRWCYTIANNTLLIASRRRKNATTANAPNTMSRTITRQLLTEPPLAKFRRKSPGEAD